MAEVSESQPATDGWHQVQVIGWTPIPMLGSITINFREEYGQENQMKKFIGMAFQGRIEKEAAKDRLPLCHVQVKFTPDGNLGDIDFSKAVPLKDTVPDALAGKKDLGQNLGKDPKVPPQATIVESDEKNCRFCGKPVIWQDRDGIMYKCDPNGKDHVCHPKAGEMKTGAEIKKEEQTAKKPPLSRAPATATTQNGAPSVGQPSAPSTSEQNGGDRGGDQQPDDKSTSPSQPADVSSLPYNLSPYQREKLILLQSCMKASVEIGRFPGSTMNNDEASDTVVRMAKKMADALMEAALTPGDA